MSAQGPKLFSFLSALPGKFWGGHCRLCSQLSFRYSLIITTLDAIQPELLETTLDKTGNVGKPNADARSCNHSCRGKVMFSLCVYGVAFVIRHANPIFSYAAMHFYLGPLWVYQNFPHYLTNAMIFGGKVTEQDMCFDFLYNFGLKNFSF
jgi:hypothetical protein